MTEALCDSLSLESFESFSDSENVQAFREMGTPEVLFDISRHTEFSARLGFDSRRICGAHNIVVISKCADSVYMDLLEKSVAPFLEEDLEKFLVSVIWANPKYLQGTTIDQISGLIRFRPHALRTAQWADEVLRTL